MTWTLAELRDAHLDWLHCFRHLHLDNAVDSEEWLYHFDAATCLARSYTALQHPAPAVTIPDPAWQADYVATHGPDADERMRALIERLGS